MISTTHDDETPADIIAFVNTIGKKNTDIIKILERTGFNRKEEFGTLVFTAPLKILGEITQGIVLALEYFQIDHRLLIMITSDAVNMLPNRDQIEAFKWWDTSENDEVVAVYDLRLTDRKIHSGLGYALRKVGAGTIFNSCRSIIRTDLVNVGELQERIRDLVEESAAEPKINARTGSPIQYHGDVFQGYILGTPRVLRDWMDYKVKMFLEKFQRMRDQLLGWEKEIHDLPDEFGPWYTLPAAIDTTTKAISTIKKMKKEFTRLLGFREIYENLGLTDLVVTNTYTPAKSVRERLGDLGDFEYTGNIGTIIQDVESLLDRIHDFAEDTKAALKERNDLSNGHAPRTPRDSERNRKLRLLATTLTEGKKPQRTITSYF